MAGQTVGRVRRGVEAVGAVVAWAAIAMQLYLYLGRTAEAGLPLVESLIRFVSFFTITTNTFVALVFTVSAFGRDGGNFFRRPAVKAAVAVYIILVAVVYESVLRKMWHPVGLQLWVDIALHDAIPLIYLVYWLALAEKVKLPWVSPVVWLAYPVTYLAWALLRGVVSGFYPYTIIDVSLHGFSTALRHSVVLLALFAIAGVIVVAIDRAIVRQTAVR
jgi:hypothetical protein